MAKRSEGKTKVIFNPEAGKKRSAVTGSKRSLDDIRQLLNRYQVLADYFPTKGPEHATVLAREAVAEGYKTVLAAGGDGTVGEVAAGLVKTDLVLGILPLGSFMNVARMLSIPADLEAAIILIKIRKVRRIDVGRVDRLEGEELAEPFYFLETAGMGLEAEIHEHVLGWERGNPKELLAIMRSILQYYNQRATVLIDDEIIETRTSMVEVSNGPWTGAGIKIAPRAKLNDHRFTVSVFRMEKWELIRYLLRLIVMQKTGTNKVERYQATEVIIRTGSPRLVHADARLFGTTPVQLTLVPGALSVITGFPESIRQSSLRPKSKLDSRIRGQAG